MVGTAGFGLGGCVDDWSGDTPLSQCQSGGDSGGGAGFGKAGTVDGVGDADEDEAAVGTATADGVGCGAELGTPDVRLAF